MNTQQPLFEVTHVWRLKKIEVNVTLRNGEKDEIFISRQDYEKWLDDADRLEFTDADGYDIPKYTLSEYWENAHPNVINQDAYDYIVGHEKSIFEDIENGIQSICKEYSGQE